MTDKWIPKDVNRMSKPVYLQLATQSIELTDSQSYTKEEIDKKLVSADMGNAYSLGGTLVYSTYTHMDSSSTIPATVNFDYAVITVKSHQHPYYLTKNNGYVSLGLQEATSSSSISWGSTYTTNATVYLEKNEDGSYRLRCSVDTKNSYYYGDAINAYFFKY